MKRIITLAGALVLALAVLAGPALAQSPLPTEAPQSPLPEPVDEVEVVEEEQEVEAVQEAQPEELAVTGLELTTVAGIAAGLLVAGGGALVLSRRGSSRS